VTPAGERWFGQIGVDMEAARASSRSFARACLDWTERRLHIGGALGDALLDALVERGLISCSRGERAVELTEAGRVWVTRSVGVDLSDDQPPASNSANSPTAVEGNPTRSA
jgi:hypothetical protein